ncbi:MAG: hypothetical protein INR65_05680 [Gluconacetobacter diazotrophicus]|nr:hypothetical protein [Gluconacetobacter diazotrophicus]
MVAVRRMTVAQNWFWSVLLGLGNLVLIGALAPPLCALRDLAARAVAGQRDWWPPGAAGTAVVAAWDELRGLAARPFERPEHGSPLFAQLPAWSLGLSLALLILLPGPAAMPGLSDVADLPTLLALLALGTLPTLIGAMEEGRAAPSLRAIGATVRMAAAAPAIVLALLAVYGSVGTLGLGRPAVAPFDGGAGPLFGGALAAALLAASGSEPDGVWTGRDLVLCRYAGMVRALAAVELVEAVALPGWLARPGWTGEAWLSAVACWPLRLVAGMVLLGLAQQAGRRFGSRRWLLGLSCVLSLAALLLGGVSGLAGAE